jgi:hypothetical protein
MAGGTWKVASVSTQSSPVLTPKQQIVQALVIPGESDLSDVPIARLEVNGSIMSRRACDNKIAPLAVSTIPQGRITHLGRLGVFSDSRSSL